MPLPLIPIAIAFGAGAACGKSEKVRTATKILWDKGIKKIKDSDLYNNNIEKIKDSDLYISIMGKPKKEDTKSNNEVDPGKPL